MEFDIVPRRRSEEEKGNFDRECGRRDGEQRSPKQRRRSADGAHLVG